MLTATEGIVRGGDVPARGSYDLLKGEEYNRQGEFQKVRGDNQRMRGEDTCKAPRQEAGGVDGSMAG